MIAAAALCLYYVVVVVIRLNATAVVSIEPNSTGASSIADPI